MTDMPGIMQDGLRASTCKLWLFLALTPVFVKPLPSKIRNEVCNMQQFNATCGQREVVMIEEARYGRMRVGKCVKENYGNIGCSTNVKQYLDKICSGRPICGFQVPGKVIYETQACPTDFTSYLETTFICLKIETGLQGNCHRPTNLKVSGQTGYLSSRLAQLHGIGTDRCPWLIEAKPGQVINLTLYNFGWGNNVLKTDSFKSNNDGFCHHVAVVRDSLNNKDITVCRGDKREISVRSQSRKVFIQFTDKRHSEDSDVFLLKYEVVGCEDIKPTSDTTVNRDGDSAVVKCNTTGMAWYLNCKGTKWHGQLGNCSDPTLWEILSPHTGEEVFPYGILIVVAIGVALGVFLGGVFLGLIIIYTRRKWKHNQEAAEYCDEKERQSILDGVRGRSQFPEWIKEGQYSSTSEGNSRDTRSPLPPFASENRRESANVREPTYVGATDAQGLPCSFSTYRPTNHIYESPNLT